MKEQEFNELVNSLHVKFTTKSSFITLEEKGNEFSFNVF